MKKATGLISSLYDYALYKDKKVQSEYRKIKPATTTAKVYYKSAHMQYCRQV